MNIRNATLEDIPSIREIKPELSPEQINERLADQTQGKADFLLLEEDGQLISFVYLKYLGKPTHPDYPDIEDLFTKSGERGKGYGTSLIKECERLAKERGFGKIGMAVNPDHNDHTRRLYEHLGYHHTGGKPYVDGVYNGVQDWCIDLEKSLSHK